MDKKTEVVRLLNWLTQEAGLTYNDIAHLTGVRRVTVANVWRKPPHYISDERLDMLRQIKATLEDAMASGDYDPNLLPRPANAATVMDRVKILESLLD